MKVAMLYKKGGKNRLYSAGLHLEDGNTNVNRAVTASRCRNFNHVQSLLKLWKDGRTSGPNYENWQTTVNC